MIYRNPDSAIIGVLPEFEIQLMQEIPFSLLVENGIHTVTLQDGTVFKEFELNYEIDRSQVNDFCSRFSIKYKTLTYCFEEKKTSSFDVISKFGIKLHKKNNKTSFKPFGIYDSVNDLFIPFINVKSNILPAMTLIRYNLSFPTDSKSVYYALSIKKQQLLNEGISLIEINEDRLNTLQSLFNITLNYPSQLIWISEDETTELFNEIEFNLSDNNIIYPLDYVSQTDLEALPGSITKSEYLKFRNESDLIDNLTSLQLDDLNSNESSLSSIDFLNSLLDDYPLITKDILEQFGEMINNLFNSTDRENDLNQFREIFSNFLPSNILSKISLEKNHFRWDIILKTKK